MSEIIDLAIVGAGPAGMAAASLAAELGLSVSVFDEQATPGGQIFRSLEAVVSEREAYLRILGEEYSKGIALVEDFRRSGASFVPQTQVWDIGADGRLGICDQNGARQIQAKHILLACGAMERPVPIPGWTLPGVMGAGAAQTLLKSAGMVPDVPTLIAGSGPLVYLIAWQLMQCGAPIEAVLLTSRQYRAALTELPKALRAGRSLWQGLNWERELRRAGIPLIDVQSIRAEGSDRLQSVVYQRDNKAYTVDVELLLLHEGVVPNTQLPMLAGCQHRWDDLQHCWRPVLDEWGRTSIQNISVAGDGGGISGAQAAVRLGRIAVLRLAYEMKRLKQAAFQRRVYPERAWLKQHLRIRGFLDRMFEPAASQRIPVDDETIVCRCEEVSAGELREIVRLGCPGPNQAKAFTRCGMGPCQGRLCGLTVSELIAAERDVATADVGHYRVRAPIKPLTVAQLAGIE